MLRQGDDPVIRSFRQRMRTIASITLFFFIGQLCTPVYAATMAVLDSAQIEASFNSNYQFEPTHSDSNLQFTKPVFVADYDHSGSDIDSFQQRLQKELKSALGQPVYVPIMVGDITVIVPTYPLAKRIGNKYVQDMYLRNQIYGLLGRSQIDPVVYGSEQEQLGKLYNNAFTFAQASGKQFGVPLMASEISLDMIWPELRTINGEAVLVPMLYLSDTTLAERTVITHQVEFDGASVTLSGLTIDNASIELRRNTFIKVLNNFKNSGGTLSAEGDLKLRVGGSFSNLSGIVQSTGDLTVSAYSIASKTIVHRFDLDHEKGGRYGEIASINSVNGDVRIRSYSDIELLGAHISAGGEITFAADGSLYIGSQQLFSSFEGRENGWYVDRSSVEYLQSKLTAEETIQLVANSQIVIDAAEIVSNAGHIELLAGLGITVEDDLGVIQSKKKGRFGKRKIDESVYQTVAMRALLDASRGIRLNTQYGDITLKAADISSVDGTRVSANGGAVNLLMTTETDHYSYSSVKKGFFTTKTKNYGHNIETGVPNTIVGGFAVEALNGVRVEYEGDPNLTLDEQVAKLAEFEGLEWMAEVRSYTSYADWAAIELQYETWRQSNTSLSPAFAAVIAIAVAVVAGPAAGAYVVSAVGATSTVAVAAINAGVISLLSQSSLALANGAVNHDIGGAMESLSSEETFKNVAVAMVTAGAIAQLDAAFFDVDTQAVNTLLEAGPATPEMIQAAKDSATQSLQTQVVEAVTNAAVGSGATAIINGGNLDDFGDQFLVSLAHTAVYVVGQDFAQEIGMAEHGGDIATATQYIAHAALGCGLGVATASINNGDLEGSDTSCLSGAGGAVIGEFVAQQYRNGVKNDVIQWLDEQAKNSVDGVSPSIEAIERQIQVFKAKGVNLSKLSAGLLAAVLGGDVNISATTAANAAENNALFLLSALAIIAYIEYVGEGNLLIGLNKIGVGDHPIGKAINEGVTAALEFSMENAPQETEEALSLLKQAGDTLAAGAYWAVTICDDLAGGACNTTYEAWDKIDPETRNTLAGSGAMFSLLIPSGVLSKFKLIRDLDANGMPIQEMLVDADHAGWNYTSPAYKSFLLDGEMIDLPGQSLWTTKAGLRVYLNQNNIELKDDWNSDRLYEEVMSVPNGDRPHPSNYLTRGDINYHISHFKGGVVRFYKQSAYEYNNRQTLGPDNGFVLSFDQYKKVMADSGGDMRYVERALGLPKGDLSNLDTRVALISYENVPGIRIPSGNEGGANGYWVPGGLTSGGVLEAVVDFSHKPPFTQLFIPK